MLSPPDGLPESRLVSALADGWQIAVAALTYRPVGFGSHHWAVTDAAGVRWFVTVDELAAKRHSQRETPDTAYHRLRASLAAARDLRDHGGTFAVPPVPTRDGEPLARLDDRFAAALYPFVDGQSFSWGDFATPGHRRAMLDLVIAVHTAPVEVRRHALADDFTVPHRDELEAALRRPGDIGDHGPYARPTALLLAEYAAPVRRLLDRYDDLVTAGRAQPSRTVLTHGEPHPGNTMRTSAGWLLIDWDTALVAPPERDLWTLDPGDGSLLAAYADATGVPPLPAMLELYRIRWDVADIAVEVSHFGRPHTGSLNDDKSWDILRSQVEGVGDRS